MTGDACVPTADSVPSTHICRKNPLNFTTTPGSIVNVTPLATVTFPSTTYGLPAVVQVVFVEIVPETLVGPALRAAPGTTTTAARRPSRTQGRQRADNRLFTSRAFAALTSLSQPCALQGVQARAASRPQTH